MYNKIYDFCKVRNNGNCFKNGTEPTPRVSFLLDLLKSEGIDYELDVFDDTTRKRRTIEDNKKRYPYMDRYLSRFIDDDPIENKYFNIILRGNSNRMVVAHHDVNNANVDNANDNSASVINAIMVKKLRPETHVVILDGEEFGGIGSKRLSQQINSGEFGNIEWVLNLELTGKGGKYFFIGDYPGPLSDKIKSLFDCPVVRTPFNDSVILRGNGIDSTVINPVPPMADGKKSEVVFSDGTFLDTSILWNCHSGRDNVSTISPTDMKEFVEEVVLKILDS